MHGSCVLWQVMPGDHFSPDRDFPLMQHMIKSVNLAKVHLERS